MSGGSQGRLKTKFTSLINGRIKENQGKMIKILVKKSGNVRNVFPE